MQTTGYIPKDLSFDKEARDKLIQGVSKISQAVKSTLGPNGHTVIIESNDHTQGLTVTKDGVTVAKSIFLDDPVENMAVRMLKQASEKTANVAGDGTTTAIVLTEAFINAGMKWIRPYHNIWDVMWGIKYDVERIIDIIKDRSVKVTDDMLDHIASISSNNDRDIGEIVAQAYRKVGKDGIVTVEKSQTDKTYCDVTNGIKIDRGWSSPMFINDQRKDECILENVKILVCDTEINNILQIENILKPIINAGERLLIIGNCSTNVINTLAANVARNGLKLCNIAPPSFGYRTHELMQDIAFATGAKYFSEKTGDDLSLISMQDLGHADKIIVGKESTIVVKNGDVTEETTERVKELREQQERLTAKHEKDFINERIASLVGGIACIYVGANSDIEQKEKFDRVDDSVCAVRSALEEGILPGGGLALYNASYKLKSLLSHDKDYSTAMQIVKAAIRAPMQQIIENSGLDKTEIENRLEDFRELQKYNYGFDVKEEQYGNMYTIGIIDPLKVTKNALLNSSSVASTILSTNAIVTHARIKS